MARLHSFIFPDIPPDLSDLLLKEDKQMVIIGVLGKSSNPDCNKMAAFKILDFYPTLMSSTPKDGRITFYFKETDNVLYVHFESIYDAYVMKDLEIMQNDPNSMNFHSFNSYARTKFAKILLFATQICHIIVMVETGRVFDSSYLSMFKALKTIRERYILKFLPKLLKNSNAGTFMGKDGRLCSPRVIFLFERCLFEYKDNDALQKLEFDIEDKIYKMLRTEFIITNNSSISLFSIPRNQRYVYINNDPIIRSDPLIDSIENLMTFINKASNKEKPSNEWDYIRPTESFAKPLKLYRKTVEYKPKERSIVDLLNVHINEALRTGFDDSVSKFKGKSHFVIPNIKTWYETFKIIHKIFIENPENENFEASDADYKSYLKNFHKIMDIDERFFTECCEYGLELAVKHYKNMVPHHYSSEFHEQMIFQSSEILLKYGRSPQIDSYVAELRRLCDDIWKNGKQQCEVLSLRNNPCIMPKHELKEDHSSGVVYISTCNCGRTQGRRDDPYTIRQANNDFYQILGNSCPTCEKLENISFPVFEPSTNDYKAAEVERIRVDFNPQLVKPFLNDQSPILSTTQSQSANLSLNTIENEDQNDYAQSDDDDDSLNEIVIKVGKTQPKVDKNVLRQPSTTEYLPGMVHTLSPIGLLPVYPSWSLCCIGPSSVYSHNTGLPEHAQSGFLSQANFLLPWDVHVRVTTNTASWAATYEKSRSRKKPQPTQVDDGQVFVLKIFVGCEYECTRGHRFIMNAPDKVLRGGSGIVRDSGSKVVFNDMPLYFPCPCRSGNPKVAQLMRIHIVTPKAPVNISIDPKIRIGDQKKSYTFATGKTPPPKLTQSAYWILRLPYIYQGEDGPILPPTEITAANAMSYGCLLSGMYGISESECAE